MIWWASSLVLTPVLPDLPQVHVPHLARGVHVMDLIGHHRRHRVPVDGQNQHLIRHVLGDVAKDLHPCAAGYRLEESVDEAVELRVLVPCPVLACVVVFRERRVRAVPASRQFAATAGLTYHLKSLSRRAVFAIRLPLLGNWHLV